MCNRTHGSAPGSTLSVGPMTRLITVRIVTRRMTLFPTDELLVKIYKERVERRTMSA